MDFASGWLENNALFPEFIKEAPDPDTGIIIVIPAFNEPGTGELLGSLARCRKPDCRTEVIIVINAPVIPGTDSNEMNRVTSSAIGSWKSHNRDAFFRLYEFTADSSRFPDWGVGMARKTGMDEAARRFGRTGRGEGIIASLDADCTVEENYLEQLCEELLKQKHRTACSIYFEHPLDEQRFPGIFLKAVTLYELHMRYYHQALKYTGFPYAFHTVGSAFAVKALPYIKSGGMNRRQAGEDFWFIQKLLPSGGYFSLNSTTIFPSPRSSERVPFGTGATVARMADSGDCSLGTYDIRAFEELKVLFEITGRVSVGGTREDSFLYAELPAGIRSFIGEEEWKSKIIEIGGNTSGSGSFMKRFYGWFNMLRIVRYLNSVHASSFSRLPVAESASALLEKMGVKTDSDDPAELLFIYRSMEKRDQ